VSSYISNDVMADIFPLGIQCQRGRRWAKWRGDLQVEGFRVSSRSFTTASVIAEVVL